MTTSATDPWVETILSARDPEVAWSDIFDRLRDIALATPNPQTLHKQTVEPDRLLAESAWSLWQDFPTHAPKVIDELKRFWAAGLSSGTAILILDALSLRELPLTVAAAKKRGVTPVRIAVRGSETPTESDQFAKALGVHSRSQLYNNKPPDPFIFAGEDTYTDVLDLPFEDCLSAVKPRAPVVSVALVARRPAATATKPTTTATRAWRGRPRSGSAPTASGVLSTACVRGGGWSSRATTATR